MRARFFGAIESGSPEFALVDTWGSLQDPDSRCTGASGTDGSVCTFVMAGDAATYLGHQTNAPGYEVQLRSIAGLEDYDPETEILECYVELIQYTPADYNARYGPALSIVDKNYANRATAVGIGYHLRPASTTTSVLINVGPTTGLGSASTAATTPITSFTARFVGIRGTSDFRLETAGSFFDAGISQLGALSQRSSPMSTDPDSYYLQLRVHKNDANSATPTIKARVWWRRMQRTRMHPFLPRAAKPTTTFKALILGDSVSLGYGTLDGGDALPAGVRVWDDGVESTPNWPLGNGSTPAPGYLRGIATAALAAGFTTIELHRWGTNGQRLVAMMLGDTGDACLQFAGVRDTIDCVFLVIGTNNAPTEAFTAEFEQRVGHDQDAIQTMFPSARIVHMHPIVDDVGWPGGDRARTAITSACASRGGTRAWVAGKGDATVDINHPTLAVYQARGEEAFDAWYNLP